MTVCCCCELEFEAVFEAAGEQYCSPCFDDETAECLGCATRIGILDRNTRTDSNCDVWCQFCYSDTFTFCDDCGCELMQRGGDTHMIAFRTLCSQCHEDHNFTCYQCERTFSHDESETSPDGDAICQECLGNQTGSCHDCGQCYWNGDLTYNSYTNFMTCGDCGASSRWNDAGFFDDHPTYDLVGSERKYGIELETHRCENYEGLRGNTVFGVKEDGSVDGLEFVSPVLYGDKGFEEVDKLCGYSRDHDWEVTSSCGYHLHCDMSNETDDVLFKVALAYHLTYEFWTTFVSDSRKRNYYCAPNDWDATDIVANTEFKQMVYDFGGEKYRWMNIGAYDRHKTFELRVHSGTMNATKIKNWAMANLRFIDAMAGMTIDEITTMLAGADVHEQFVAISKIWDGEDSTKLSDYYRERAAHFNKPIQAKSLVLASI